MTKALRTPDERFADLPGFPFAPHYLAELSGQPPYAGLRMHYLDEGPRGAKHVALCLHGQPSWSYLYRRMIPVAPDLFGFGRSDKPVDEAVYTFDFHRESLRLFIEKLDLRHIMLVCQDWGGLLGLTLPMDMPGRFDRLLVMNTTLGVGDEPLGKGFLDWRAFSNANPDMAIGRLFKRGAVHLSEAEASAYDAPFPDASYKAGVRRFPNLVPDRPDAPGAALSRRARAWWGKDWQGESFMAVGAKDPVLGPPVMAHLRTMIRNCPEPMIVPEGGHFVQEWGTEIAQEAVRRFGTA